MDTISGSLHSKKKRLPVCSFVFFWMLFSGSFAYAQDITPFFCDAVEQEKSYESGDLKSYRVMVPGQDGWIFRSNSDFKTDFSVKSETLGYLKDFSGALARRDIMLVILYPPTRGMVHFDELPEEQAERYHFTTPETVRDSYKNLLLKIRQNGLHIVGVEDYKIGDPFFYKRDHHWNSDGSRRSARNLARYVEGLPVYKSLRKTAFKTSFTGKTEYKGTFHKAFKTLCNTSLPPEEAETYMTEPVEAPVTSDELLGSAQPPEVVLLGTSNSVAEQSGANFEGFLKEALSTDILNMSVSAASIDTALISYLNTEHFKSGYGKLLIWEVPGYYYMDHWRNKVFRQVIPAVEGVCGSDHLVASGNVSLQGDSSVVLLEGLAGKNIRGPDYYVSLTFSNVEKNSFALRLISENGNSESFPFARSKKYLSDNQFYVLIGDKTSALDKLVLEQAKGIKDKTLTVRICKR